MKKTIEELSEQDLKQKIDNIKVEREKTANALKRYEEDGWGVVALDEIDKKNEKSASFSTEYRVEKIYTNLECGLCTC